ncbi:thiol:disulfide interchange protein DsbA/DsbL [Acinetobacter sp. ASP199]|uniref:thiol:disulfide interchange protein DsbA/DsbL n=1 Tax=unclassified Acinetobacter TaxID=196816 RepID=UPI001F60DC53|nr:thiol:disulfide interchange protein DsbA/DsbL [Acinetobacter sp. ASP199]UNT59306.1 thiol:disulfide interchange protein DsbA/DsbL [Acinetobacter sp. ASP199]
MKKFILGTVAASVLAFSGSAMANFVAGQDYQVLANPVKVEKPGKIEVREFFWYGCGHCYTLEPHMQTWLKQLPKDIRFVRTPAAMNPLWEQAARAYYVSEALGVRQKAHLQLFHNIHEGRNQSLLEQPGLAKFYTRYGISEAKFNSTYKSFPISSKIAQAKNLAASYQLTGVPAVTVNGKYVVQGDDAKVIQVVNFLVEKERKAK